MVMAGFNHHCPRTAFLEDLAAEISEFLEAGDQIVLLIDGNSNMKDSDLRNTCIKLSLKEAILSKHGLIGPSTFRRNHLNNLIDGVWLSQGLDPQTCGYFGYDSVVPNCDHRCLWVDLSFEQSLGHIMPAIQRPKARRLIMSDPRIVDNFIQCYKLQVLQNDILTRVRRLEEQVVYPLPLHLQSEYERLDQFRLQAVAYAEKRCRKLCIRLQITAWSLIEKKKKNMTVSSRYLQR
jgi:hypothetical protein